MAGHLANNEKDRPQRDADTSAKAVREARKSGRAPGNSEAPNRRRGSRYDPES